MNKADLIRKVKLSVNTFLKKDCELLNHAAHEQAISHRIAVYLEPLFDTYNIDCEYNKHGKLGKSIDLNALDLSRCSSCGCTTCRAIVRKKLFAIKNKPFRPDIIIHSRGNDAANVLVVEIKKDKTCPFDCAKLTALTTHKNNGGEYGYQFGVFIRFKMNKPEYLWFIDGKSVKI